MSFQLVRETISHETIEALRQLHEGAVAGDIKGIIFGVTLKRGNFLVDSAGDCRKDPTRARGIAAALDDELARMVHHRGEDEAI